MLENANRIQSMPPIVAMSCPHVKLNRARLQMTIKQSIPAHEILRFSFLKCLVPIHADR